MADFASISLATHTFIVRTLAAALEEDPTVTLQSCHEHVGQDPDGPIGYARRGLTLLLLGNDAEADADFDQFRRRSPEDAGHFQELLRQVLERRGRKQIAPEVAPSPKMTAQLDAVFAEADLVDSIDQFWR